MDPPVPIPNTVVKHSNAESTWMETSWEDRKLPVKNEASAIWRVLFSYIMTFHPSSDLMRVPSVFVGGRLRQRPMLQGSNTRMTWWKRLGG